MNVICNSRRRCSHPIHCLAWETLPGADLAILSTRFSLPERLFRWAWLSIVYTRSSSRTLNSIELVSWNDSFFCRKPSKFDQHCLYGSEHFSSAKTHSATALVRGWVLAPSRKHSRSNTSRGQMQDRLWDELRREFIQHIHNSDQRITG